MNASNFKSFLITASAIGYYGNHPSSVIMDEASPGGDGFLAKVCRQWEEEAQSAGNAGIRVVNMRLGIVLGKNGGAMAQMIPIFNLGLGVPWETDSSEYKSFKSIDEWSKIIWNGNQRPLHPKDDREASCAVRSYTACLQYVAC